MLFEKLRNLINKKNNDNNDTDVILKTTETTEPTQKKQEELKIVLIGYSDDTLKFRISGGSGNGELLLGLKPDGYLTSFDYNTQNIKFIKQDEYIEATIRNLEPNTTYSISLMKNSDETYLKLKLPSFQVKTKKGHKRKAVLFVIDLVGTFDKLTNALVEQFIQELEIIKERHQAEKIIISFSTNNFDFYSFEDAIKYLKPYIDESRITLGNQYSVNQVFSPDGRVIADNRNSKIDKIIDQVSELENNYEILFIGYADDNLPPEPYLMKMDVNIPHISNIIGFIPGYYGLEINNPRISISNKSNIIGLVECLIIYNELCKSNNDSLTIDNLKKMRDEIKALVDNKVKDEEQRITL